MAYLNVRERVIETKIAYVGAELAGKATNFEHLSKEANEGRATALEHEPVEGGALLSFQWRPHRIAKFNDCDVLVRLVTSHGAVSSDKLKSLLDDADGVVVVVDSDPAAQDRNRQSVDAVRGYLAKGSKETRPVVVQVNKRDLPDALPSSEIVGSLEVSAWPHVTATAARGEGVMETLEKALSDVIESVKRTSSEDAEDWEPIEMPTANGAVVHQTEGNPLLAALRQILRESISERVGAMEDHVLERVERQLASWSETVTSIWSSKISASLASLKEPLAALTKESAAQTKALAAASPDLAPLQKAMSTLASETTALSKAVQKVLGGHATTSENVEALVTDLAALKQTVAGVATDVASLQKSAGASGSTESAALKKSIASLANDVAALRASFTGTTKESAAYVRQGVAEEETQTRALVQALDAKFDWLVTELKKPKKSWFT